MMAPGPALAEKHTVHWFRKGLRLHDNPSLVEGLKDATTFRCVFIIDPWFAGASNVGINKWRFLLQCLKDLDSSLRRLNSRLFVVRGQPADALPKLFREWGTTNLTFEEDPEPYGRVRDHNIITMCKEIGISVVSKVSHTLYTLDKIIEKNGGRAPLTYYQFQTVIAGLGAPCSAEATITADSLGSAITPISEDHDEKYGVPSLEELGFDTETLLPPVWVGGETEALTRLERHLERKAWVASFGRPKMTPQSLLASQTGLSPYLRFGCLSTRLFYYQLTDLYKKIKKARPPLSLHGQLLWREFFYCAATKNPNFDKMVGNPICVQIPWDKNSEALAKWANGQTGYPWIDAIMIQLREEGWIHHLARHAVACFLTRGDLWLSWEEGMKVFEELLLDADWSVNAGTWMWLSCSSFFQQFFHCYCPVRFGRKADPNGDFIRRYIPALKNFPTRFIHSPWLAPAEVQQAARCTIGKDYPLPMVEHAAASRSNIQRIKQVYNLLDKYRPQEMLTVNNINRSNIAVSSPSPNSVIRTVNHSNYYCYTPDNQKTDGMYSQQNQNEEQENQNYSHNKKLSEDYENCNKTISDLFADKQMRNNSGLQVRNMPFKKIVIVEHKYENIKENPNSEMANIESYENDNDQYVQLDKQNYNCKMSDNYQEANRQQGFYVENVTNDGMCDNMKNIVEKQQDQFKEMQHVKVETNYSYNKSNMDLPQQYTPTSHTFKQPSSDTMYDMKRKSYCITKAQTVETMMNYNSQKNKNFQQNYNQNMQENYFTNSGNHINREYRFRMQAMYMNKLQNYDGNGRYDNSLKSDANYEIAMKQSCMQNHNALQQNNRN